MRNPAREKKEYNWQQFYVETADRQKPFKMYFNTLNVAYVKYGTEKDPRPTIHLMNGETFYIHEEEFEGVQCLLTPPIDTRHDDKRRPLDQIVDSLNDIHKELYRFRTGE